MAPYIIKMQHILLEIKAKNQMKCKIWVYLSSLLLVAWVDVTLILQEFANKFKYNKYLKAYSQRESSIHPHGDAP